MSLRVVFLHSPEDNNKTKAKVNRGQKKAGIGEKNRTCFACTDRGDPFGVSEVENVKILSNKQNTDTTSTPRNSSARDPPSRDASGVLGSISAGHDWIVIALRVGNAGVAGLPSPELAGATASGIVGSRSSGITGASAMSSLPGVEESTKFASPGFAPAGSELRLLSKLS